MEGARGPVPRISVCEYRGAREQVRAVEANKSCGEVLRHGRRDK